MKKGGTLFIAEVLSRFTDISEFNGNLMRHAGFEKVKLQKLNDFFYIMVFNKIKDVSKQERAAQMQ